MILLKNCWIGVKQQLLTHSLFIFVILYYFRSSPVDYNLYRRFWSLQDYFRKPVQCYDKIPWKQFVAVSTKIWTINWKYSMFKIRLNIQKWRVAGTNILMTYSGPKRFKEQYFTSVLIHKHAKFWGIPI